MALISAEIHAALEWFGATHALVPAGLGGAMWTRVSLPGPGSVGEQDELLMTRLDTLLAIKQAELARAARQAERPPATQGPSRE